MKRIFGVTQIVVILLLVVVATLVACRGRSDPEDAMPPLSISSAGAPPKVTVAVVRPNSVGATIEVDATGTINYRSAVDIVPQVGGRVIWVAESLRAGGEFKADQTLFQLDPIDAKLGVEQAKADLAVALADMNLTEAERNASTENYLMLNPGAEVPELIAREPQLRRSQAAIDRAKARLRSAELTLRRTEFRLPFDGRVVNTNVSKGQLLNPNQPVGQVYALEEIEASIPISTYDLEALQPAIGRGALIQTTNGAIQATIERQSAELNTRTRTTTLYARLESEDHEFAPGNFIEVRIFGRHIDPAFVLPETTEQAKSTVWLVKEGVIIKQPINIHDRREDGLLVDAFEYFDGIVSGSMPNLEEGDIVRVADMNRS
ncbi:MAG: efflux RND transporter periplasmic adaptor subunit [Gammaproteobacteria bacterium]|nr:efflux RND transporter periplasmic adaptor subunit [Gammaproteobacteria bacterium]